MKKLMLSLLSTAFILSGVVSASAASLPVSSTQSSTHIKEGVTVTQKDGYTVTVKTKVIHENLDSYIKKLQAQGVQIYRINQPKTQTNQLSASYLQNDTFSGSGSKYDAASGKTGYINIANGKIGLNFTSGHISATLAASISSAKAKPRLVLTTYGFVGGSSLVSQTTVYDGTYATGTSTLGVDADFYGAVAYYQLSGYGDFNVNNSTFTAQAQLN